MAIRKISHKVITYAEEDHDIDHPLYIKYVWDTDYQSNSGYSQCSYMQVTEDDRYTEINVTSHDGRIVYEIDTGVYNYSGRDIDRILGRENFESSATEFAGIVRDTIEFLASVELTEE